MTVYNISGNCKVFIGGSGTGTEGQDRLCYNCGKPGHLSRDCAKPRRKRGGTGGGGRGGRGGSGRGRDGGGSGRGRDGGGSGRARDGGRQLQRGDGSHHSRNRTPRPTRSPAPSNERYRRHGTAPPRVSDEVQRLQDIRDLFRSPRRPSNTRTRIEATPPLQNNGPANNDSNDQQ